MNKLSPSLLASDFANLGRDIKECVDAGAPYIHIDVMDGSFVPALSMGQCVVQSIRPVTDAVFDVHLMVVEPIRYVEEFAKLGADIITVHLEACEDVAGTLNKIRDCGCKAGLSIKPATDVKEISPFLELTDMVLIMSVEPGYGGQKYIEATTDRIKEAKWIISESGYDIDLEVDGGITLDNVKMVLDAGINVVVTGSSVFRGNITDNVKAFNRILQG